MKKRTLFIVLILGLLTLTGGLILKVNRAAPRAAAAPTVLVGSLEGGCYLVTATSCKLSVEPFSIRIAPGEELLSFNLTANDQTLYDFGASTADPLIGDYVPSSVALDFAARCGQTYIVELHALDTGDLDFVTIGQTQQVPCPSATYKFYVPFVGR
jgi:hypothetical protein